MHTQVSLNHDSRQSITTQLPPVGHPKMWFDKEIWTPKWPKHSGIGDLLGQHKNARTLKKAERFCCGLRTKDDHIERVEIFVGECLFVVR